MLVIEDAWNEESFPGPTIATVGNFDGIHEGQRLILERLRRRASASGAISTVVTFEPHPLSILRPERPLQRITIPRQKIELLKREEIGLLTVVHFSQQFSTTSAERFVEEFLHHRLRVQEVHVGSRFSFGHQRLGNLSMLRDLGERLGFGVEGVEELQCSGEIVSSTRIRQAIRAGDVALAYRMLARPYAICGVVVPGKGRGKTHGWPTINLQSEHDLMPADGVYVSKAWLPARKRVVGAVTNIGRRPTFPDNDQRVVEAHLFDFEDEIYGETVELGFAGRLRGERRFPSAAALARQIAIDAEKAREYLTRPDCCDLVPTILD